MTKLAFALSAGEVQKLLGVTRQLFEQSLRPLMEKEGECRKIGRDWAFDGSAMWRWEDYLRKRAALIDLSREDPKFAADHPGWNSKRPYRLEDRDNLVDRGVYDGKIDHPVFTKEQS